MSRPGGGPPSLPRSAYKTPCRHPAPSRPSIDRPPESPSWSCPPLAAGPQLKRQIGTVGGEDVDAKIEHLGDRGRIVASPAADAEAGLSDGGDGRRIEHIATQTEHGHAVAAGEVDHCCE